MALLHVYLKRSVPPFFLKIQRQTATFPVFEALNLGLRVQAARFSRFHF